MWICEATKCKKKELCLNYTNNYFKYNPTSDWRQIIDWSIYESGSYYMDKYGHPHFNINIHCGDDSIIYPNFVPIQEVSKDVNIWIEY